MCWNERVSLNTYIVALFGTVFGIMNGMPINVLIWLHTFSSMQLVEYFIWKNLNEPYWNQFFSFIGLLVIVLEPVASIFLMKAGSLRNSILAAYAVFILSILYVYYPWNTYTTVAKNRHLYWKWWPQIQNKLLLYIVCFTWIIFFFFPILIAKYYILAALTMGTIIITMVTFTISNSWGSMWCWIANGVWLFVIGYIAADKCFENLLCKKKND